MRKALPFMLIPLLVLIAFVARSQSPGMIRSGFVTEYLAALDETPPDEAWGMLSDSLALLVSPAFLDGLEGLSSPERVLMDGTDSRGIRMAAVSGGNVRVVWLAETEAGYRVRGDAMLDGLLGGAVLLCRAAAASGSGVCPVSGREYSVGQNLLICPSGHLGSGLRLTSEACAIRRGEVAGVVRDFLSRGYSMPTDLESIHTVSGGEIGQRGGWRCPDNGYSYYVLQGDSVLCLHHAASTPVNP